MVLDKGKVVGKGKHKDLIRDCKAYQEICESQLSEEEYRKELEDARA